MTAVMEAPDGCFFDRRGHPCNLTIGQWMLEFRQTMFDPVDFGNIQAAIITLNTHDAHVIAQLAKKPLSRPRFLFVNETQT